MEEGAPGKKPSNNAGSPPLVARVASFRRKPNGAVKVAIDVLGPDKNGPKALVAVTPGAGGAEKRQGGEREQVDESVLGGRVMLLTHSEAEAMQLYAPKDSGMFYLDD